MSNSLKTQANHEKVNHDFNDVLTDANELAQELEIEPNFPSGKKKKQFEYEHEDESLAHPKINFKVNF